MWSQPTGGLLGLPPCAYDHITVASDDIQRLVLCEIAYLFVSAVGSIDLLAGWCILLRDILESQAVNKDSVSGHQKTEERKKHLNSTIIPKGTYILHFFDFNAPKYQHRTRWRKLKGLTFTIGFVAPATTSKFFFLNNVKEQPCVSRAAFLFRQHNNKPYIRPQIKINPLPNLLLLHF